MSLPFYYSMSNEKYNPYELKESVLEYLKNHPCFLCGKIHKPVFFIFAKRTFKKENGFIVKTKAPRLLCESNYNFRKNKNGKKPYTITILPSFLIPYSRIPLDNIMNSVNAYITDPDVIQNDAADLMWVDSIKSFIRHFVRIKQLLPKWINFIAKEIINLGGEIKPTNITDIKKYTHPLESKWLVFKQLVCQYFQLYLSLPGTESIPHEKYYQFIHCKLAGAGMSLGP